MQYSTAITTIVLTIITAITIETFIRIHSIQQITQTCLQYHTPQECNL